MSTLLSLLDASESPPAPAQCLLMLAEGHLCSHRGSNSRAASGLLVGRSEPGTQHVAGRHQGLRTASSATFHGSVGTRAAESAEVAGDVELVCSHPPRLLWGRGTPAKCCAPPTTLPITLSPCHGLSTSRECCRGWWGLHGGSSAALSLEWTPTHPKRMIWVLSEAKDAPASWQS